MAISDELNRIIQAKAGIKLALEEKGLTIGDSSTLDEYPALIQEMEVGGGGADTSVLIDLIEGDISNLVIPNGTTKIGDYAFYNASQLTGVSIPNTVTSIGAHAFEGSGLSNNSNLDFLSDTSINSIGNYAFNNFNKLNDFELPNTVTTIGEYAFAGTYNNSSLITVPIKRAIFHDNIEIIKRFALSNRPVLSIYLGRNVKTLEREALKNTNSTGSFQNTYNQYWFNDNGLEIGDFVITAQTPPNVVYGGGGSIEGTFGSATYGSSPGWKKMYVPGDSLELYKTTYGWSNVSTNIQPLAAIDFDEETYTVTALGRDNLELYVDASLCDSSVYTFPVDNRNHTIEVKSVDPSLGVLDSSTMTVYIGEPQYMALTCSDPNGATVSMTQTLGNNSGVNVVDMKYSTDGTNWNNWTHTDVTENDSTTYTFNTISLNEGDKVYFKGDNSTGLGYTTSETGSAKFVLSGNLGASGNVMSLLYDDDFQEYNRVPNFGLSSLFTGCTSLTTAPELPATTLGVNCYSRMFYGCTSLTTAPELPATTLGNWCYSRMFQKCTSLNYVKAMFTAQEAATNTQYWLNNVSATGTFVKNPDALWSESDIIPSGWTVETAES